ncbi:MAG: protein kinase domain-containing protein, partial [Gemmatimonadaceae bacterium]
YYTMPFIRGESLRVRLATGELVPVAEAVHILRDVARALAYAHGEGVVHRDIKPENVLLSGGAAVVTDLGIAKAIDISRTRDGKADGAVNFTLTQAGSMLGTPAYMAPEQAAGDPGTDHRADIYAWGLIAWELLAGRHPFGGRTSVHAIVAAQLSEMPAPLVSVRTDVPAALSELVQRCLAKDPDHRPASARAILAALDEAASTGSGTAATPVTAPAIAVRRNVRLRAVIAASVFALAALAVWFAASRASRTSAATADKSLAVIPFASLSGDTANAYLAEGIAGEVTNTLSDVPGLRLAGRSSAARFAGARVSAQDAGRTLGVASILDGTVQRARDQIRVSVELTNVSDGQVTWHDDYTRSASDIIAVQDDISRAIAGQLQVTLANAGSSAAHGTNDPTAYDLYLRGQYLYRRRGAGIAAAIAAFEQATVRDSTFARAWAALSNALTVSPSYVSTRMGDVLPRARAAAERAVRLDSTLSEAYLALGYADAESFHWPQAEAELRRAIALDPNAAEPRYRLGYTFVNQGRMADAIPVLQQAVARDPLYFMPAVYLGWAEASAGRVAEGLEEERRGLALEPGSISSLCILALGSANAGLADSAKFYARRIVAISSAPSRLGVAAHALALAGDQAGARELLRQIESTPATAWTHWTGLALAYAGLRDTAQFINAVEQAARGDGDALPTYSARIVNEFPADPRIVAVLRRYNLDPARFLGHAGAPDQ